MSAPETLAQAFHEAYERLAPSFGYKTREASAVPWDDVPEPNRSLMVAVAGEVLAAVRADALRVLVGEARANHVRWQHEAELLEECTRTLCIGAKLLLWPDIENPRAALAPSPAEGSGK